MRTNIINAYLSIFLERVHCYDAEINRELVTCSDALLRLMTIEEYEKASSIRDEAIATKKRILLNEIA